MNNKATKVVIEPKAVSSRTVDGLTEAGHIAQLFASIYHDLYNIDEMQDIRIGIASWHFQFEGLYF